jgi:uncharacterized protein (DUF697 family)
MGIEGVIHRTSVVAGTLGAILSPIPLLDEIVLAPIYAVLAARIAAHRSLPLRAVPWQPIMATTFGGLVARGVVNVGVAFVPGVSAVANAATAVALTEVLGRYIDRACEEPATARPLAVKEIIALLRQRQPKPAA